MRTLRLLAPVPGCCPRLSRLFFLTACLIGQAVLLQAQFMVPPLSGPVVDEAGMLDGPSRERIQAALREVWKGGGSQYAVLTVPNLAGESIESASIKVTDLWKLGDAKKDNGVLIMLASAERKIRIEVGQGLEGELTDAFCSRVIRETMTPLLRRGRAGEALEAALAQLMAKTDPGVAVQAPPQQAPLPTVAKVSGPMGLLLVFLILWAVISFMARLSGLGRGTRVARRREGFWGSGGGFGGGGFGGGGGGFSGGGGGFSGGGSSGGW